MFGFQRLDAYQCAIELVAVAHRLDAVLPRGHGAIREQLRRASISIPLNIAEGSGRRSNDATRFYSIARGSALECADLMDVIDVVRSGEQATTEARRLLVWIVGMLTKLETAARDGRQ